MLEAGVMIVVKDGLALGISRRNDVTKFGLPGGKVEKLETPMQAAIRETFEETSIIVDECVFLYDRVEPKRVSSDTEFKSYCFFATKWKGDPSSSDEGIVKWCTRDDLLGKTGAFPQYNEKALEVLKTVFPNIIVK
jgi:8-oxo-dGTP pyrophosphatase MutT (NUDIX family)